MVSGYLGAHLSRLSQETWLCSFGDEDKAFEAIHTRDVWAAFRYWFDAAQPYLVPVNWYAVALANCLGLVDDWPAESPGLIGADVFMGPNDPDADNWSYLWVDFRVDPKLVPLDRIATWATSHAPWIPRVLTPRSPEAIAWEARKASWVAGFA
jgi:hypothetical protein